MSDGVRRTTESCEPSVRPVITQESWDRNKQRGVGWSLTWDDPTTLHPPSLTWPGCWFHACPYLSGSLRVRSVAVSCRLCWLRSNILQLYFKFGRVTIKITSPTATLTSPGINYLVDEGPKLLFVCDTRHTSTVVGRTRRKRKSGNEQKIKTKRQGWRHEGSRPRNSLCRLELRK